MQSSNPEPVIISHANPSFVTIYVEDYNLDTVVYGCETESH
jgi:hypothetical protein